MIWQIFEIVAHDAIMPGDWERLGDMHGTESLPEHYTVVNVAVMRRAILIDWFHVNEDESLIVIASPHLLGMGWSIDDLERYAALVIADELHGGDDE